jgi:hypothetical protein
MVHSGVFGVYFVSETAQVELKSGRVLAHASSPRRLCITYATGRRTAGSRLAPPRGRVVHNNHSNRDRRCPFRGSVCADARRRRRRRRFDVGQALVHNRPISVYCLVEMPIQSCGESVSAPRGKAGVRYSG